MNWLREHMRDHVGSSAAMELTRNVLKFTPGDPKSGNEASVALDLVAEAADVIKGIERRATESEVRAKTLAESAIEKLHLADSRIQASEEARRAAEENLAKVSARLQEAEKELAQTKSWLATADSQLANANQRAKSIEIRAINAERAVKDVEHAIRTQLVGLTRELTRGASAAMA